VIARTRRALECLPRRVLVCHVTLQLDVVTPLLVVLDSTVPGQSGQSAADQRWEIGLLTRRDYNFFLYFFVRSVALALWRRDYTREITSPSKWVARRAHTTSRNWSCPPGTMWSPRGLQVYVYYYIPLHSETTRHWLMLRGFRYLSLLSTCARWNMAYRYASHYCILSFGVSMGQLTSHCLTLPRGRATPHVSRRKSLVLNQLASLYCRKYLGLFKTLHNVL
jgi:hypothetical protein